MTLPLKPKPKRSLLSIRLDADERREVIKAARRKKVTLTEVARAGALSFARQINAELTPQERAAEVQSRIDAGDFPGDAVFFETLPDAPESEAARKKTA